MSMDELYKMKRALQREKREIRKKAMGIDEDHTDTSMQRIYGEGTKTRRALKVELFGSKTKSSAVVGDETSIEVFVREVLDDNEVEYVEQKAIRFINVDFFVPDLNLAIQVNGCYWHACPTCYPDGPKNKTQRKNIEKDKQSSDIIASEGANLLNVWEHEIKKSKEVTRKRIEECLSNLKF